MGAHYVCTTAEGIADVIAQIPVACSLFCGFLQRSKRRRAIILAKVVVFALSSALGIALTKSSDAPGMALSRAGLFALCSTMSDDIGLGLPLLSALFSPEYASLLFILSALQASAFNTVGFVLLGLVPEGVEHGIA